MVNTENRYGMIADLVECSESETQDQIGYLAGTTVQGIAYLLQSGQCTLKKGVVHSLNYLGNLKTEFGKIDGLIPSATEGEKKFRVSEIVPMLKANPIVNDDGLLDGIEGFIEKDRLAEVEYNAMIFDFGNEFIIKDGNKRTIAFYENRKDSDKDVIEYPVYISVLTSFKLNLGCGFRLQKGYINIDNRPEVKPDLVCDITEGLPYDDDSVDEVRAWDFLEHILLGKTVGVIEEIWRVLKPGGIFESFTPDAEVGQAAFQDPDHKSFWVQNSWLYYSHPQYRTLYGTKADFNISKIARVETDKHARVYHLHVIAEARKEEKNA